MNPSNKIGKLAENFACHYLSRQGLKLVERNYSTRWGEIDLIMLSKQTLIFVEVRLRNAPNRVSGKESINYFKQQRVIKAAAYYISRHRRSSEKFCRFDVMDLQNHQQRFKVEWIKNAFELSG